MAIQGFWSYVHKDDEAEGGRISQLGRDLAGQFELLGGEHLDLFLDRDALRWGDAWRDQIESSLATVAFFVPVITPRYFTSPECRRELQFFSRRAEKLGIGKLLLPVLYADIPSLLDQSNTDDLAMLVAQHQWEDWREIRFAPRRSGKYRRAVARMAQRLLDANRQIENRDKSLAVSRPDPDVADPELPGLVEQMAAFERAFPELKLTAEALAKEIDAVRIIMAGGTSSVAEADKRGEGFASRLKIAQRIAARLLTPAERVASLGAAFASQMHDIDQGVRLALARAAKEVETNPNSLESFCAFAKALRLFSGQTHSSLEQSQNLINAVLPLEQVSRDFRPPVRLLRQGLTTMIEAGKVTEEWVSLVEASGISCGE